MKTPIHEHLVEYGAAVPKCSVCGADMQHYVDASEGLSFNHCPKCLTLNEALEEARKLIQEMHI